MVVQYLFIVLFREGGRRATDTSWHDARDRRYALFDTVLQVALLLLSVFVPFKWGTWRCLHRVQAVCAALFRAAAGRKNERLVWFDMFNWHVGGGKNSAHAFFKGWERALRRKNANLRHFYSQLPMSQHEPIALLRELMRESGVAGLIVPSADPHLSEYPPEHWKLRQWLTGFTGSAGTLVLTARRSALWVDSRYYLQAEQQLRDTEVELCRLGQLDTPTLYAWFTRALEPGSTVGFDGRLFPAVQAREHIEGLAAQGFAVNPSCTIADDAWAEQRSPLPAQRAFIHAQAATPVRDKLAAIRAHLQAQGAQVCLLTALDEVAWVFNLRGADIAYTPVALAFGYIDAERAVLFIAPEKLAEAEREALVAQRVELRPYADFEGTAPALLGAQTLAVDMNAVNYHIYSGLLRHGADIIERSPGVVASLKARKTPTEVDGFRIAMLHDGAALAEFLCWLERNVGREPMDELSLAQWLLECRQGRPGFVGESFAPIVAYGPHAAIVHYSATPQTSSVVGPSGFLLLDTGGHYLTGTTDITRTLHLGQPTAEERHRYTLVLKGMIALSRARFPHGTHGGHLDTLARQPLWAEGLNYGHGTGHGVGCFLNVHEGPQQIRPQSQTPIEPGMVISNEPGVYIDGRYGIRIENLMVCRDALSNDFGRFLDFETLTLCPISTKPLELPLLAPAERAWLNAYHAMVRERIAPLVGIEVRRWLERSTSPI